MVDEKYHFEQVYYDFFNRKYETFKCPEPPVIDKLCAFHHQEYWKDHKEELVDNFVNMLINAMAYTTPLFCISCHLPRVYISLRLSTPVYFTETIFNEGAIFEQVFFKNVDFSGAQFAGPVRFEEVKFLGKTIFDKASFSDEVSFLKTDFSPDSLLNCLSVDSYISFRTTNFEKQEKVVFDSCRMDRVSFLGTQINRIVFRNVNWREYRIYDEKLLLLKHSARERKKFIKEGKRKLRKISQFLQDKTIYDKILGILTEESISIKAIEPEVVEIAKEVESTIPFMATEFNVKEYKRLLEDHTNKKLQEIKNNIEHILKEEDKELEERILDYLRNDENLTLDNVLAVYRGLRENYDYYLRYDESGKFFVNEMKLRKRFSGPLEKIVLWIYELLALYGESYTRPIAWTLITIFLFSLLRTLSIPPLELNISQPPLQLRYVSNASTLNLNTFIYNLKTSMEIFFQLHYDDNPLTLIERLVSIPILGSLYIALRRKLERRIRH